MEILYLDFCHREGYILNTKRSVILIRGLLLNTDLLNNIIEKLGNGFGASTELQLLVQKKTQNVNQIHMSTQFV